MTHSHHHPPNFQNERRVFWAMIITAGFMVVEVIGGLISGSLALLADAGHMLTDAIALLFAWIAFRMGRRPSDHRRSYGYHRLQILAAFINGVTLIGVVGWIVYEAIHRLFVPTEIVAETMLVVAALGLIVNIIAFLILHGGDQDNLNLRSAALHVVGDMLGSGGAIIGAVIILAFGWLPVDSILSLIVALLILSSSWTIIKKTMHILLEGTPDWLDIEEMKVQLALAIPEIEDIHHVHAWSLTTERPMITLHARVYNQSEAEGAIVSIKRYLHETYEISHSTIQVECGVCIDER